MLQATPVGLTVTSISLDDETFIVFAFPRERDATSPLTDCETEVAELILHGRTTAQIAVARGVSRATVASQLQSIYRKLGVASRVELVCKLG